MQQLLAHMEQEPLCHLSPSQKGWCALHPMASQISWLVRKDDQSLSLTLYQHLPRHVLNSKEPEEE